MTPQPGNYRFEDFDGQTVVASDGSKIGTIADVYFDNDTGKPEWALVNTGLFGTRSSFVPITQAQNSGDGFMVPFTKDQVKDAPHLDDDGELSQEEEDLLSRHYGLSYSEAASDSGLPTGGGQRQTETTEARGTVGHDTSGPTTDSAMTRSEEQLNVGVARRPSGLARLRKYVVTEQVNETVPVTHEEARIIREPITDANVGQAMDGPAISEEEHEVELLEEQVVVSKEAVPVERVRLDKETVTEQQTVSETVRKEQIEFDEGGTRRTDVDSDPTR